HDPQINTEVVEIDYDDGLDLPQKIEGQFTVLFLGFDEDVCNTDIMWIMEFDIRGGKMNILQIPRDSFMPYYTSSPNGKANSIYNLGRADVQPPIQRVVDAVEESFGIPIDAYITTVCTDIVDIVDLIGGIPMHLEEQIMYEGDKIIPAGDITLSGQQTEWFMRYRYGWLEGDIGRVKNQRRFMAAAMKKLISIVGGGEDNLYKFLYEIYKNKWIATDMSVGDLTKLGDFAGTIELENVFVNMVPGEGSSMDNLYIGPDGNGYSLYSIHKQETIDMLNKYYRPYQRKMLLSDSTIAELYTDHAYGVYDDTGATLDKLERATEPPRDPNK
ncbi:MAG: LCP family protein, partial [Ruminococcus sp.]|nr:LCP family protein [Ruminococcus sp.]